MALDRLKAKTQAFRRDGFMRAAGVLVGGTALAQAIAVSALPLLTRLYSPADFEVLAIYASSLAILAGITCLRLEIAIPLPKSDEDAANLLGAAIASTLAFSVVTAAACLVASTLDTPTLLPQQLRPYLWILPLGVLLAGTYSAIHYWTSRKHRFPDIAATRIRQTLAGIATQCIGGLLSFAPSALLIGHIVQSGAGAGRLALKAYRSEAALLEKINYDGIRTMVFRYKKFPLYSTVEVLANNLSIHAPLLIIAALATGPEAGFLLLATRIMSSPLSLIGTTTAQVFLAQGADQHRINRLPEYTLEVWKKLMIVGVGPVAFAGLVAPSLVPTIFGNDWTRAGQLLLWMTPWFIAQLLASPVSMTLHITGNQGQALVLQVFGVILRIGAIALAYKLGLGLSEAYAVSGFIFYIIYLVIIIQSLSLSAKLFLLAVKSTIAVPALWLLAGTSITFFM